MNEPRLSPHQPETPLQGWKEIAGYLQRDERTARRWELSDGLPIRRHRAGNRGSVYAYPSEIETWRAADKPKGQTDTPPPAWRRFAPAVALSATLLISAVIIGRGPILNPTDPVAEAADAAGPRLRQVWADEKTGEFGTISADGRYVSFTDWDTGDLAIRDLQSGENHHLTSKGSWSADDSFAEFSAISPDARHVAYAWYNAERKDYELRLIDIEGVAGGKERTLVYNEELTWVAPHAWLPDLRTVVVLLQQKDGMNRIGLVSTSDGSVQVLKTLNWSYPNSIQVSPDGKNIAYDLGVSDKDGNHDIYALAVDGRHETGLVVHPSNDELLGWTPNGKGILFSSNRSGAKDAYFLPLLGVEPSGTPRLVMPNLPAEGPVGLTTDGTLYYTAVTGGQDVYVAEVDFETGELLKDPIAASQRYVGWTRNPSWSPDGKYLLFVSRRGSRNDFGGIVVEDLESGEERELHPALAYVNQPEWSPDGRFLLAGGSDLQGKSGFFRIDALSSEFERIPTSHSDGVTRSGQWGLDNQTIYWSQDADTERSIRTRDLKTGEEKVMFRGSQGLGPKLNFRLSPDGTMLAIHTRNRVLIVPTAGGEPRELFRAESKYSVRGTNWLPDGSRIVYSLSPKDEDATVPSELWSIPVSGGKPTKTALSANPFRTITIHPDGRRIAYQTGQNKWEIWAMEGFLPEPTPSE